MSFLRGFLAFAVGLTVVAALLYRVVPGDTEASDAAAALSPRCQVLLVGPSYIRFGVDARLFEDEAKRLGTPTKACKFTRLALRSYELKHELEVLFERRWPRLQRVVVDVTLGPSNPSFSEENWYTTRVVHWHTLRGLRWLWENQLWRSGSLRDDLRLFEKHLEHVAMNYLGIGRGAQLLKRASIVQRRRKRARKFDDDDERTGVFKADTTAAELAVARSQLIADKAQLRAGGKVGDAKWPRELEKVIREQGYEPIFVYSPVIATRLAPPRLEAGQRRLVVLDFADPVRYPELYTLKARGRGGHLSRDGAATYSRLLARELAKLER